MEDYKLLFDNAINTLESINRADYDYLTKFTEKRAINNYNNAKKFIEECEKFI